MEKEVAMSIAWCRRRYLPKGELGHWLYFDLVPYTDALLQQLGLESGVYKAPHDPRLLKRPLPLAQLARHAVLPLSQSTYSLL
jgi:hypothetical protein